jgi:hypothetical protein
MFNFKKKNQIKLDREAATYNIPVARMNEIHKAFEKFALMKLLLSKRAYVNMYRFYNPMYSAYAEEIADRVFIIFGRKKSGYLNFNEFLSSILVAEGRQPVRPKSFYNHFSENNVVFFGQQVPRHIPIAYPLVAAPSIRYQPCGNQCNPCTC